MSEKKKSRIGEQTEASGNEAGENTVTMTQEQFDEIKKRIDELMTQRDDYLQTAQRLQAEFDNFRKRNASIRQESLEEGARETVRELLPIIDSLERAQEGAKEDNPYTQGIVLLRKQALDILTKLGLEEIDTTGEFNADLHDALMQVEAEGIESGHIAQVMQKGYLFKGRAIRYSMVKVAK